MNFQGALLRESNNLNRRCTKCDSGSEEIAVLDIKNVSVLSYISFTCKLVLGMDGGFPLISAGSWMH